MKSRLTIRTLPLAVLLLAVTGCFAGSEEPQAGSIHWVRDHAEGLRLLRETGKPGMLYFTADWCAPCVELKKYVFTDKRVVAASRRLVNIYIDADKDYDTLADYKVRGIPAIFFLNPQGEIIEKFSSDRSAAGFVKKMTAIADKYTRP
jgi:thiol:disulfide interchange protein DsbD